MSEKPFVILPSERAAFVGKTQSGKTHAAGLLALPLKRFVCVDGKGLLSNLARTTRNKYSWRLTEWFSPEGAKVRRQMEEGGAGRLRCPVPIRGDLEPLFTWLWNLKNVTVYIDEMYSVTEGTRPGDMLRALYTRGAEWDIGVWAAAQRPRDVPRIMFSEAEWRFQFLCPDPDDRVYMRRQMGGDTRVEQTIPERAFWLYNMGWDAPRYYPYISPSRRVR